MFQTFRMSTWVGTTMPAFSISNRGNRSSMRLNQTVLPSLVTPGGPCPLQWVLHAHPSEWRHQLTHTEGLGNRVDRPQLQSGDPLVLASASTQKDEEYAAAATQIAQDVECTAPPRAMSSRRILGARFR